MLGPGSVDGCGIGDGTPLGDFELTIYCTEGSNPSPLLGMKEGAVLPQMDADSKSATFTNYGAYKKNSLVSEYHGARLNSPRSIVYCISAGKRPVYVT